MDLLLEDICKLDWAASLVKTGGDIVKFINNHQTSLAIYREHSEKELRTPGEQNLSAREVKQLPLERDQ